MATISQPQYSAQEFTGTFGIPPLHKFVISKLFPDFIGTIQEWNTKCLIAEVYDETQIPAPILEIISKKNNKTEAD